MTLKDDAEFITDRVVAEATEKMNAVLEVLLGDEVGYQSEKLSPRAQVLQFAETLQDPWGIAKFADRTYRRLQETARILPEETRVSEGFDDRGLRMLAALIAAQYAGKMRKLAVAQGIDLPLLPIVLPPEQPPAAMGDPYGGPTGQI